MVYCAPKIQICDLLFFHYMIVRFCYGSLTCSFNHWMRQRHAHTYDTRWDDKLESHNEHTFENGVVEKFANVPCNIELSVLSFGGAQSFDGDARNYYSVQFNKSIQCKRFGSRHSIYSNFINSQYMFPLYVCICVTLYTHSTLRITSVFERIDHTSNFSHQRAIFQNFKNKIVYNIPIIFFLVFVFVVRLKATK